MEQCEGQMIYLIPQHQYTAKIFFNSLFVSKRQILKMFIYNILGKVANIEKISVQNIQNKARDRQKTPTYNFCMSRITRKQKKKNQKYFF